MSDFQGSALSGSVGGRRCATLCYALLGALLFALIFQDSYRYMWSVLQAEDNSYCLFVPLIVAYLVWEKRSTLAAVPAVPSWGGVAPLLAGSALYWLGELGGEYYCIFLGSWLVLVGLVWCWAGWPKLRTVLFPVCFLVALFPFPAVITSNLTLQLKLVSTQLGVAMIRLCGLSAYREGNLIDLGFTKLQVVDACSGLRYFFPLTMLAILLAYFYKGEAAWKRIVLVFSAVPVAVITNSLRIASVGLLYQVLGPMVVEGFFHDFSGWFIFMLSLALLLLEMRILKKVAPRAALPPASAARPGPAGADCAPRAGRARWVPVQMLVALVLLAASASIAHSVNFREKVPANRPFAQFPLQLSNWQGVRVAMQQEYLDVLKFDDYLMMDYRNPAGQTVSFYTAYYGSQAKGESIHSPATCLPGNGWIFEESGTVGIPLAAGAGTIRVNRAFMQKTGVKELTYYWFPQHGRVLTSLSQLKLSTFWSALTSRRTDAALVRIITPVYENEQLADAEARLQGFTREIAPVLAQFLPI
jgi:exosortase D (VPLPA-CTERM-specific)